MVAFTKELHNQQTLVAVAIVLSWTWWNGLDAGLRYFMIFYFIVDIMLFYPITSSDMIFHHLLTLLMVFFYWDDPDAIQLVLTEISTPFLIFYHLRIGGNLNKLLFIMTFSYFRIYNMGLLLVERRHEVVSPTVWLLFLLFSLNCYWAEKIIRKITPPFVKTVLLQSTPYSRFLTTLATHHDPYVRMFLWLSPLSFFFWHHYQTVFFYTLDLFCFHSLSFLIASQYTPMAFLSLPFHLADILLSRVCHKICLFLSIGYDIILVFCYKQDFLWLFGWSLVALLLVKQTFGHGPTQSIVHMLIGFLLIQNG
jgi:hypothetical protein